MIAVERVSPDLLAAVAHLIRIEHGPGCPEFATWRQAAALLDRVAAAEETGAVLRVGERRRAVEVVCAYLGWQEVPA